MNPSHEVLIILQRATKTAHPRNNNIIIAKKYHNSATSTSTYFVPTLILRDMLKQL